MNGLYSRAFSADPFLGFFQPWLVKLYRKWIPEWERGINVRRDAGRKRTGYRNTKGARAGICTRSSALLVERPNQQTAAADITYKNFHCGIRPRLQEHIVALRNTAGVKLLTFFSAECIDNRIFPQSTITGLVILNTFRREIWILLEIS